MSAFIIILAYILVIGEFIWYFTCTEHKDVPLILVIITLIIGLLPGFNCFATFIIPMIIACLCDNGSVILKNNWFNRKFLAYRE